MWRHVDDELGSVDVLGDESLWRDEMAAGEAGGGRASVGDPQTVSWDRGAHPSVDDVHCMELFGLGPALDYAAPGPPRARNATNPPGIEKGRSQGLAGGLDIFPHLQQAMVKQWRRAAVEERVEEIMRLGSPAGGLVLPRDADGRKHDGRQVGPLTTRAPATPPTPSEVLAASSIRLVLSMASAFRRSNPAVLQAMCGTLLELLLETPPLVLAPLHRNPRSIEAATFSRVADFCAQLIRSSDHVEREPALGLYLALAVARGEVSGLLEAVSSLLDVGLQASRAVRNSVDDGVDPTPSISGGTAASSVMEDTAGFDRDRANEQDARVSTVLDRLASYRVDLYLSFPDECDPVRLAVNLPARVLEASLSGSGGNVPTDVCAPAHDFEWDCPVSVATDGEFVYAWHPGVGLLKAGTGMGGTVKGRLYAVNSEAGRLELTGDEGRWREGFIAVIGDTLYLRARGRTLPGQFLVAQTSDLAVTGATNAVGLALSIPTVLPASTEPSAGHCSHQVVRDGGENKSGDTECEEKLEPADDGAQEDLVSPAPSTPLCCDGRLLYALLPMGVTGGPSVIAVDLANTGRMVRPAVELQRPELKSRDGDAAGVDPLGCLDPTVVVNGESPLQTSGSGGIADAKGLGDTTAAAQLWPWWQDGRGAIPGVCTYCNGDYFVVCWPHDVGMAGATEKSTSACPNRAARAEARLGIDPSPDDSVAHGGDADLRNFTHAARFQLSTGACESVKYGAALSGTWGPGPPCMAYDPSNNWIMRCALHQPLPFLSSREKERSEMSVPAELSVLIWRNGGLAPGPLPDGAFGWQGALRALAGDDGGGAQENPPRYLERPMSIPSLSKTAVFVLAHLDRLGAHYLGLGGGGSRAGETGASSIPRERVSSIPFCYDLSHATFRHLVDLVETFGGRSGTTLPGKGGEGGPGVPGHLGLYVLCASLRLLNTNIGILLSRGDGVAEFGGEALRESLLRCLLGLVKDQGVDCARAPCQSGGRNTSADGKHGRVAAAREALRLLVDGMDLFYPTKQRQACLLSSYLHAYRVRSESLPPAARTLTLELLARASSLRFLQSLGAAGSGDSVSGFPTQTESLGPGLASCEYLLFTVDIVDGLSKALLDLSIAQSIEDVRLAASEENAECASIPEANIVWTSDHVDSATGQLGLAVLEALGTVLKLRCANAFCATKEYLGEDGGYTRAARGKFAPFLELFLLVLQAADDVLIAAAATQDRATPAIDTLPRVVDALRGGLVGTLLPSCLASALTLLDEGGRGSFWTVATEPSLVCLQERLVQVIRKLGFLLASAWRYSGPREGSERTTAIPVADEVDLRLGGPAARLREDKCHGGEVGIESTTKYHVEGGSQEGGTDCSCFCRGDARLPCETARGDAELGNAPACACRHRGNGASHEIMPEALARMAWLLRVERLCAMLGASLVRQLVIGEPQNCEEKANAQWLFHPLLAHAELDSDGLKIDGQDSASVVDDSVTAPSFEAAAKGMNQQLLQGGIVGRGEVGAYGSVSAVMDKLCSPSSQESRALSAAMRRVVLEDRGHDKDVNEVVWAAAVAAVHHADLAGEAAQVARAELARMDPSAASNIEDVQGDVPLRISPAMIRAWRSAQQARFRLEGKALPCGDKNLIVRRAYFLLSLKPWASTTGVKSSPLSDRSDSVSCALMASELVLQFLLRPAGSAETQGRGDIETDSIGEPSVGAQVVAQEGDPDALFRTIKLRSVRAMTRARGFSLAARLLDGMGSDRSVADVLWAVADGLARACLGSESAIFERKHAEEAGSTGSVMGGGESSGRTSIGAGHPQLGNGIGKPGAGRLHFLAGVECCSTRSKLELVESLGGFLRQCSIVSRPERVVGKGAARTIRSRRAVLVRALRATSMDYELGDHDILHRSELLPLISKLVDDVDRVVAAAASEALQALYRCALPKDMLRIGSTTSRGYGGGACGHSRPETETTHSGKRGPSTPFQAEFFGIVRRKVEEMAEASGREELAMMERKLKNCSATPQAGRILLGDPLHLRSDQAGMVVPHFPLGTRYSLSFWVFIPLTVEPTPVEHCENSCESKVSNVPAVSAEEHLAPYVVAQGACCVVRRTPSLDSEEVGVLYAADMVELGSPEPRWARHPLVSQGRRVRLTWPIEGYASLYTADGSFLLEEILTPCRRRASDSDLGERAERTGAESMGEGALGRAWRRERRRRRTPDQLPTFSGMAFDDGEEGARSRSVEPPPRRSNGSTEQGNRCDVAVPEGFTPTAQRRGPAGGILLFKGNEVSVRAGGATRKWDVWGIEATSAGALRLFVGEGGPSEAAVTSPDGTLFLAEGGSPGERGNDETDKCGDQVAPGWRHIAVVQDRLDVSLFVSGRRCAIGSLPRHLVEAWQPQRGAVDEDAESSRPHPNTPRSTRVKPQDLARCYDDHNTTQPRQTQDTDGCPALSERARKESASDTGASRWQDCACYDVSPWPIYLGQPPPYASRRKTIDGGSLSNVRVWERPLRVEEVEVLAADTPSDAVGKVRVEAADEPDAASDSTGAVHDDVETSRERAGLMATPSAQVLALAHACCRVDFGRQAFLSVGTVRAFLRLVLVGGAETRGWVLRVCRTTLPWVEQSLVDEEFRSIVREREPSFEGSFVESCLLLVGKISSVWGSLGSIYGADVSTTASPEVDSTGVRDRSTAVGSMLDMLLAPSGCRAALARVSAREAFSLSSELVSLLHDFAASAGARAEDGKGNGEDRSNCQWSWGKEIARLVGTWLRRSGPLVQDLQRQKALEEKMLWQEAKLAREQRDADRKRPAIAATEGEEQAQLTPLTGCATRKDGHGQEDWGTGAHGRVEGCLDQQVATPSGDGLVETLSGDDLGPLVAVLSLLGGLFECVYPGSKVLCRIPPTGNAADGFSGRSNHEIGFGRSGDILENSAAEEATVLRIRLSRGNSRVAQPVKGPAGDGRVDDGAQQLSRVRRPVLVSELMSPTLGRVRPLDVYDGLAGEAYDGTVPAAVAIDIARDGQSRPSQHEQEQQQRRIAARMATARLGNVLRGQDREVVGVRGRSASPDARDGLPWAHHPGNRRSQSPPPRQRTSSVCGECVTVGLISNGRGNSPHVATIPIDDVTPMPTEMPRALARTLALLLEEYTPELKGLLEADTAFRGPTYSPFQRASDHRCVVESMHPYQPGEDRVWPIVIEGAETVEISFDPMSRVANPGDQLILSWHTPRGGGGHRRLCPGAPTDPGGSGRTPTDEGASQTWPGVGGEPPLVVMANTLKVRFVSAVGAFAGSVTTSGVEGTTSGARGSVVRAWGFRLTATGRKVRQVAPRARPPSLTRAILCDLRARTAKCLAVLLEHSEAPSGLAPLVPALTKAALGAAPETCDVVDDDSGELPEELRPVDRRRGARYSGRDGGEMRQGNGRRPPLKMRVTAGGADVSDIANSPGRLEQRLARAYDMLYEQPRPPHKLPEAEFVLFPYSNSTTAAGNGVQADDSTPGVLDDHRTIVHGDGLPSRVEPLPRQKGLSLDTGAAAGNVGGEPSLASPNVECVERAHFQPKDAWPRRYVVCVGGVEAFDAPGRAGSSASRVARLRRGAIVTVVAQERDWLQVMYDASVIFKPPVAAAAHSTTGETDDSGSRSTTPAHAWVRQRQDDTIFLLPEALVGAGDSTMVDPDAVGEQGGVFVAMPRGEVDEHADEDGNEESLMSGEEYDGGEWRKPHGEEAFNTEIFPQRGAATTHIPGRFRSREVIVHETGQDLRGCAGDALWSVATDTLCMAAARFGISALLTVAGLWRGGRGQLFSLDLFGSVENFWMFLRFTNYIEQGNLRSAAMTVLWQRVGECVQAEGETELGKSLVACALGALQNLATPSGTRAVARILETPHPYRNKMDVEWNVHLPGALRIKVVFDPRSRTETNCDWVSILQEPGSVVFGSPVSERREHRYHGRGGRENFPGFGGRPPLWLEGDRFVARFHSDLTTTDWGVRFTAYGMLGDHHEEGRGGVGTEGPRSWVSADAQGGTPEGTVAGTGVLAETGDVQRGRKPAVAASAAVRAGNLDVELCCWLLEFLNRQRRKVPGVTACLRSKAALGVLRGCLKVFSRRRRLRVLRLVTCVIAEARLEETSGVILQPSMMSRPLATDGQGEMVAVRPSAVHVDALLQVVLGLAATQRTIEGAPATMSPYLKALGQCAALLHAFLADVAVRSDSRTTDDSQLKPRARARSARGTQADGTADLALSIDRDASISQNTSHMLERSLRTTSAGANDVQELSTVWAALSDLAEGATPVRMLWQDFLPILTEAFSMTVQSGHPFDLLAQRRVIVVPGAVEMQARFDHRTEMRENDSIVIRNPTRRPVAGSLKIAAPDRGMGSLAGVPSTLATPSGNLLDDGGELTFVGLARGTDEEDLPLVSVGDWVVRGPDWAFGDEDGGCEQGISTGEACPAQLQVGVVVGLEAWGEKRDGTAARVRWAEGMTEGATDVAGGGRERGEAFEALYSVQNPAHVRVVKRGGADRARRPIVTGGDTLEVEVVPAGGEHCVGGTGDELTAAGDRDDAAGGQRHAHCFRFDGKSTYVDLPNYGGMRLEGDFTLELWAWLEPGAARDGKPKCIVSRALDQPLRQSRRGATGERPNSGKSVKPSSGATSAQDEEKVSTSSAAAEQHGMSAGPKDGEGRGLAQRETVDSTTSGTAGTREEAPDLSPPPPRQTDAITPHSAALPLSRASVAVGSPVRSRVPSVVDDVAQLGFGHEMAPPVEGGPLSSSRAAEGVEAAATAGADRVEADRRRGDEGKQRKVEWEWVGLAARTSAARPSIVDRSPRFSSSQNENRSDGGDSTEGGQADEELFLLEEDEEEQDEESEVENGAKLNERQLEEIQGTAAAASPDGVALDGTNAGMPPAHMPEDSSTQGQKSPPPGVVTSENVYLGLRVKRGPDWRYRQQDGGGSKAGTVVGTRGLDGACPPDGDNPSHGGWTKVRWDNGRANSYETGARGNFAISFEDAVPGTPLDLIVSSVTDRSISISWSPPSRRGRPPLHSYIIYCDDVEIASVGADTHKFTNTNRMRGWPYSYSVAAQGPSGTSPCCTAVAAATATEDDRRTQLALWVGGQGDIEYAMGNERGKGVILGAGKLEEGVWTRLAVSVEGRKVSVFVDGERRATGKFVGRRLCSRFPSPSIHNLSEQGRPNTEPLRLGSRGKQDYWRGRLCGMRVWGVASSAADLRRRATSFPSASLVRAPPPPSFEVALPRTQEAFRRLRVHAPLPDPSKGAADAPGVTVHGAESKAYYEVTLRSGGCMQIGWALPSSLPSSRNLGVGDDDYSWAVDGLRAMKWHGNTSPVSSPYAHGVPYGRGWRWNAGDVIGCAVDLGAGAMSFSHNGRNLGKAFVRAGGRGTGRYRVIAPDGVKCRVGVDPESEVVETFSVGTVLQVPQVENLSRRGTWRLRTAEGWVAERAVDDPDKFFLERLEQDTCDFSGAGVGAERCVFADALRLPASALGGEESRLPSAPHALCEEIEVTHRYAEVVDSQVFAGGERLRGEGAVTSEAASRASETRPRLPSSTRREGEIDAPLPSLNGGERDAIDENFAAEHPPTRSLLTRSVEVGDADAVTIFMELFVPTERAAAGAGGRWGWGVVVGDFDIYLSTQCGAVKKEKDNGGGDGKGEDAAVPGDAGAAGCQDDDSSGGMHVVIEGPGGFFHALPVCSVFQGRWMTLRVVARRSGESLLVCTPGPDKMDEGHSRGRPEVDQVASDVAPVAEIGTQQLPQQRQLGCTFSNPRFFRGDRVGCVGLYSERSGLLCPGESSGLRFFARHAVVLLGPVVELPPPTLPRLWQLEQLVSAEHSKRLHEPRARPLLVYARRLHQLWSGEVPMPMSEPPRAVGSDASATAVMSAGVPLQSTAASIAAVGASSPSNGFSPHRAQSQTLTVWETMLSPGRVALGTSVSLSRSGTGSPTLPSGGERGSSDAGQAQRRCLTAWEHPALQTPARFESVPLPPAMSTWTADGSGLWAWAPVPRSEAFLAIGLVFTASPEPPLVTDVRCVLRELVRSAEPQKCKVVTLQRGTKQRSQSRSGNNNVENDVRCEEIVIVKEMGVCVPKEGLAWGLCPRVVIGDAGIGLGRRQPRWDGLMPTLSGTAGQSMVINLGHSPFRHPMDGYPPVCEAVHADARFVLQVYNDTERMWQDVRRSHGLLDARTPPRAPDLIGSWVLGACGPPSNLDGGKYLENDVVTAANATSLRASGGHGAMVRLPPARAGGELALIPGGPPVPVLKGAHEVWGFCMRVSPLFPSNFESAHGWLRRRFEAFTALVWGEEGQAQAANAQLIRYVNEVSARRGLSKDALLSCDWAKLQPSYEDLADWPLLQWTMQPGRMRTGLSAATERAAVAPPAPSTGGGVEETKESGGPSGDLEEVFHAVDNAEGLDEWVVATPNAPSGGVGLRSAPLLTAKVIWRLSVGQIARLLPRGEGKSTTHSGENVWREVRSSGGETGWVILPPEDGAEDLTSWKTLERFWTHRCLLDGFTPEVSCVLDGFTPEVPREAAGGGSRIGAAANTETKPPVATGCFWLPLRRRGYVAAPWTDAAAGGPSPFAAVPLEGDSDALLLSAVDAGPSAVGDAGVARPLLVTGKWKIGLVTDTLTVTTRTSGCTRFLASSLAEDDVPVALAGHEGNAKGGSDRRTGPLPVLVDGITFGFRGVDGLLVITRALQGADRASKGSSSGAAYMEPVEQGATTYLGGVTPGAEVSFSIVDAGEEVMFSCRVVGGRPRAATVRAKCSDTWGRGCVALGARVTTPDSTSGWVRVVSQAHGATVRSGMSIDADGVVGRIPCGTVVPYDNAIIYHSPGAPDRGVIDPVIRYRCIATATTPAGWISERGRYADHPYRICERICALPQQPPHLLSHVSVASVSTPPVSGGRTAAEGQASWSASTLPRAIRSSRSRGVTAVGEGGHEGEESEWKRRLDEISVLSARFHLLQQLNRGVWESMRHVNFSQGDLPWSMAGLLSRCRHLIFSTLKQEMWETELARTSRSLSPRGGAERVRPTLELRLSRGRASRYARLSGRPTGREERHTLFGQAFLALRSAPAETFRLRPGEVLYSTVFLGEHAHDAGGPYRESFAEYCAELQSSALPLLIRCPNAVNDVGINREKWLPNPSIGDGSSSADLQAEMLVFLGRLMGVAVRSHQPLDLDLPSIVWKQLVRAPITRHDLEAVDCSLTQSLSSIRAIHLRGVTTDEAFRDMGLGGFEVATADGGRAELPTPGGASREITLENRLEFADMAEAFKMREFWAPVEAIRRGMGSVIPVQLLRLFSWDELEVFVCGRKGVDVDLLEACTEYNLCNREDAHVSAFWDVLRSFSPKEKALFLRFAWGRSRLPMNAEQFHEPFKIQAFPGTPADAYLPVAHTCFFSLELPRYSSREVLEAKLRYAIHNCLAIDADDTSVGRNAAGMGWGEEP